MTLIQILRAKRNRNYVSERKVGVIPGCLPAVDCFITRTQAEVDAYLSSSADVWCEAQREGEEGEMGREWEAYKRFPRFVTVHNPSKV